MTTPVWAIALALFAILVGVPAPLLIKKGAQLLELHPFNLFSAVRSAMNLFLISGCFLYVASVILFLPALKVGELSLLYPLASTSYVWVCLISKYYLNEHMNRWKWSGVFCIILGVVVISLG